MPTGGHDVQADADSAFVRALYADHAGALLAFVTRLTRDRAAAEDIVQETFVRAWRHATRLVADERPLRPWLFTVASRLVVDGHRARRARPPEVIGDETVDIAAPGDEVERAIEARGVATALASISAEQREAIIETYYRGRSVAEAAATLGVPPGTVKSRVYYGLRALRRVLAEGGWTA